MRIVDLSATLETEGRRQAPWWARSRVRYQDHRFGARVIRLLFGVGRRLLPDGLGWANETLRLSTHGTTHVDAPWHFAPVADGRPARTIDELPLEWFHGPGLVLDFAGKQHGEAISVDDLQLALAAIDHRLQPGDIPLIRTGCDRLIGSRDYFGRGPGVSAEATRWIVEQGVRLMGIDAWTWDVPLPVQAAEARRQGRPGVFWAAHYLGRELEHCHMERLVGLDQLPAKGFTVCAFPLKVKRGSAGPARVVALLPEISTVIQEPVTRSQS